MLLNKTTQNIIRVLLVEKRRRFTLRELAKKAGVSLGMTAKIVGSLEAAGHVRKKRGVSVVSHERLLGAWSHTVSVEENEKMGFLGAERPQYLIRKISGLLKDEFYAFTLFSATELVAPYVAPNKVHLYILKERADAVSAILKKNGLVPAAEGNVVCYLADRSLFYGCQDIRGAKAVSLPQLYVDLVSVGGRGGEAAEEVIKIWGEEDV